MTPKASSCLVSRYMKLQFSFIGTLILKVGICMLLYRFCDFMISLNHILCFDMLL